MTLPSPTLFPAAVLWPGSAATRDVTLTVALSPDRFTARLQPDRFRAHLGADMPRLIRLSLGAVENLVATATEVNGVDISGATFEISLGSYTAPGSSWLTPDSVTHPNLSTVVAKLLVGTTRLPAAGRYWLWLRVADGPEIVPVRASQSFTVS